MSNATPKSRIPPATLKAGIVIPKNVKMSDLRRSDP